MSSHIFIAFLIVFILAFIVGLIVLVSIKNTRKRNKQSLQRFDEIALANNIKPAYQISFNNRILSMDPTSRQLLFIDFNGAEELINIIKLDSIWFNKVLIEKVNGSIHAIVLELIIDNKNGSKLQIPFFDWVRDNVNEASDYVHKANEWKQIIDQHRYANV